MSGRRKKLKTQDELFLHILNKWLDNERQCLAEWGIGRRDIAHENLNKEYKGYLDLWEQLERTLNEKI